jgi:RimJ/RimL family protein N-acetyltransferase
MNATAPEFALGTRIITRQRRQVMYLVIMGWIQPHRFVLRRGPVTMRPMTDMDLPLLLKWNNDPEVLRYAEGETVTQRTAEEVTRIYGMVSKAAFCFIIEVDGQPIGECWLQTMNLERIRRGFPGVDLRRIDIAIGEKRFWGHGVGTTCIGLLVELGFEQQHTDAIFACDIAEDNSRSRAAFENTGFELYAVVDSPEDPKAARHYDLVLTRARYQRR